MADDMQSKLSGIASGFNKALNQDPQAEQPCPHCGKTPSDTSPSPSPDKDTSGQTLNQRMGSPF